MRSVPAYILLTTAWAVLVSVKGIPTNIRIGGLFESGDEEQMMAFRLAANRINADNETLPSSILTPIVEKIERGDSYRVTKKACGLLSNSIVAIFGPSSEIPSIHVTSICDVLDIPHLEYSWNSQLERADLSLNLFPKIDVLGRAYVDLVRAWNWTSFSVVYEENEGIIRLQDFFTEANKYKWSIKLWQFKKHRPYREVLWKIKQSGETKIVLDVRQESLFTVLEHAQQVGMMTESHSYLITSLDLHTIDMDSFKYCKTNITGFRLIDDEGKEFKNLLRDWKFPWHQFGRRIIPLDALKTETALLYDAVRLFAEAIKELDKSQSVEPRPIECGEGQPWDHGSSLINIMKQISFDGLTGEVVFDSRGFRSEFVLDIVRLTQSGLKKIGTWNSSMEEVERFNMMSIEVNKTECGEEKCREDSLENKVLVVTTVLGDPYTMRKEHASELEGNNRYEGFAIDLIQELSKIHRFNYRIKLVDDGAHGIKNENKEWNGMIKEVMTGVADIAIADLTITKDRESAVDFTMPFMNTGISILYKRPTTKSTSLFSFLSPFTTEVWIYVMAAYLSVSVLLFIVGRLSPYEWKDPHPCRKENQTLENSFSLLNSLWFIIGSHMQQGTEIAPTAMSTRTIASVWYFFTLIIISSYTANLAAFLTVEKVIYPIENADDLVKQTKIKYGCLEGGSTKSFFQASKIPTYAKMWEFMKNAKPSVFAESNKKGIERVRKGNYAYLMESASIEFTTERECDLTQIGGLLDSKAYGIATKKGSPYRTPLSNGILQLQEDGTIYKLKNKWWKERKGGGQCIDKKRGTVTELSLGNVGGVFVVMLGGLIVASVFAIFELLCGIRRKVSEEGEPFLRVLVRELKIALLHRSSTKPVKKNPVFIANENGQASSVV